MNSNTSNALFSGFMAGLILMGLLMTFTGSNNRATINKLKEECELNIPRNQSCIMQFVPEKK